MISEMPGCCGITVIHNLDFLANDDEYSARMIRTLDEQIEDARMDGTAVLATIAPEISRHDYQLIRQALLKRKFRELATSPSAMWGGYQVHLFGLGFRKSIQKEKRSDHRKRSVVLHRRNTR